MRKAEQRQKRLRTARNVGIAVVIVAVVFGGDQARPGRRLVDVERGHVRRREGRQGNRPDVRVGAADDHRPDVAVRRADGHELRHDHARSRRRPLPGVGEQLRVPRPAEVLRRPRLRARRQGLHDPGREPRQQPGRAVPGYSVVGEVPAGTPGLSRRIASRWPRPAPSRRARPDRSSSSSPARRTSTSPPTTRTSARSRRASTSRRRSPRSRRRAATGKPTKTVKINKVTITVTPSADDHDRSADHDRRARRNSVRPAAGRRPRPPAPYDDRVAVAVVDADLTGADRPSSIAAVQHERGLLVDPHERRTRGEQVDRPRPEVLGGGAVVREDGEIADRAQPDRVRTATGIDHGVTEERRPRARRRHHPATVVHGEERLEQRAVLQHRSEVQRRAVGRGTRTSPCAPAAAIFGSSASPRWSTESTVRLQAQALEVGDGPLADPSRLLERGRGREHDDLVGAARGDELGVERPAPVLPFATTDEGERTGGTARSHGREVTLGDEASPPVRGSPVRSYLRSVT